LTRGKKQTVLKGISVHLLQNTTIIHLFFTIPTSAFIFIEERSGDHLSLITHEMYPSVLAVFGV